MKILFLKLGRVIFIGSYVFLILKSGNIKRGVYGFMEGFKGMGLDLVVLIERFCNEFVSVDIMYKYIFG